MIQFHTEIFCDLYYKSEIKDGENSILSWFQSSSDNDLPDVQDCSIPEVQVIVSRVLAIVAFLTCASSFLVAGFYGSLSDRYGRKLVCQIFGMGGIVTMLCYICVTIIKGYFAGVLLVLAPIVRGLLVGEVLMASNVQAYIADCTTPETRTVVFGHFFAAFLGGVTLGPTVASLLIAKTGKITSVFYLALVIYSLFFLYSSFYLPESLDQATMEKAKLDYNTKPKPTILQKINIFSALNVIIRTKPKHINRHALPILAAVQCTIQAVTQPPVLLYAMLSFHWTAYESGFFLSVASGLRLVVIVVVLPFLIARYQAFVQKNQNQSNMSDEEIEEDKAYHRILFNIWMTRLGLSIEGTGFILMALATSSLSFAFFGSIQAFAILAQPTIRSLYSTLVDPSEIGTLLGSQALLESVTLIIAQPGISLIYSESVEYRPNLTLYVCSAIIFVGVLLAFLVHPVKNSINHHHRA
ncbi:unnamed protein product [Cunninghamella blakesleeana]